MQYVEIRKGVNIPITSLEHGNHRDDIGASLNRFVYVGSPFGNAGTLITKRPAVQR